MEEVKTWFEAVVGDTRGLINFIVDQSDGKVKKLKSSLNRKNLTALHYAAFYGQKEIIDFLLKNDAGIFKYYSYATANRKLLNSLFTANRMVKRHCLG